jgi:hypothetical protein
VTLEPSDDRASRLELAGRGPGSLEAAHLGDMRAQMRGYPLERAIELRA